MSLAWNTVQMLSAPSGEEKPESTPVEFHFSSWRELYDKSILTADRHHSSAGEWVLHGDNHFYTVTVTSRPVYALPQHLCLSFDCFSKKITQTLSTAPEGTSTIIGPPIDDVAFEFITLLSLFAREPMAPLGIRRIGDRPITIPFHHSPPPRHIGATPPPPVGINSPEFISVVKGLAQAEETTRNAALAASRLYYAALSLVGFDPAGAYVSLVCAMECLAGHHYEGSQFDYNEAEGFKPFKPTLEQIAKLPEGAALANKIKEQLIAPERFLSHKFRKLINEYLPESFWNIPDELFPYYSMFPAINRDNLDDCLRDIYKARSTYVHSGKPFPPYIEFGLRDTSPVEVGLSIFELREKKRYLPPLFWFERVVHLVIIEYLCRSFAPELVQAGKVKLTEKRRLLAIIANLPTNVRAALEKLMRWTSRFLGMAVVNPLAPNKDWADDANTVQILYDSGLIDCDAKNMHGNSWLKDRFVGEVVGEYFFGVGSNPFRDNEVLLPEGYRES
jgi:hypothetical protein